MIQLTITADRLLQHIRTYQYRIDNFAGPNSAAQSRKADLELGDFTPAPSGLMQRTMKST